MTVRLSIVHGRNGQKSQSQKAKMQNNSTLLDTAVVNRNWYDHFGK